MQLICRARPPIPALVALSQNISKQGWAEQPEVFSLDTRAGTCPGNKPLPPCNLCAVGEKMMLIDL